MAFAGIVTLLLRISTPFYAWACSPGYRGFGICTLWSPHQSIASTLTPSTRMVRDPRYGEYTLNNFSCRERSTGDEFWHTKMVICSSARSIVAISSNP